MHRYICWWANAKSTIKTELHGMEWHGKRMQKCTHRTQWVNACVMIWNRKSVVIFTQKIHKMCVFRNDYMMRDDWLFFYQKRKLFDFINIKSSSHWFLIVMFIELKMSRCNNQKEQTFNFSLQMLNKSECQFHWKKSNQIHLKGSNPQSKHKKSIHWSLTGLLTQVR